MTKISIIIPVYNCEKYVAKCVDSLLRQTLNDIEIILINDGSTDNSLGILKQYNDNRIKIITKANGGQSSARNVGMEIAKGEYIGFVDSDDWVAPDYYEKLYNTAIKYHADIAMSDFVRIGVRKYKVRLNITEEKVYERIENKIKAANALKEGCVWNKIYKRNILSNLRFCEGMFFEDGPFTLRALYACNKLVTVPGTLYFYFQNPLSTVKTMDRKKRLDKQKSKADMLEFIKLNNINIEDKSYWAVYKTYTLFNIVLLTLQKSINTKRFMLFGVIPLWQVAYD